LAVLGSATAVLDEIIGFATGETKMKKNKEIKQRLRLNT
jgi:hypothetical protein